MTLYTIWSKRWKSAHLKWMYYGWEEKVHLLWFDYWMCILYGWGFSWKNRQSWNDALALLWHITKSKPTDRLTESDEPIGRWKVGANIGNTFGPSNTPTGRPTDRPTDRLIMARKWNWWFSHKKYLSLPYNWLCTKKNDSEWILRGWHFTCKMNTLWGIL